MQNNSANTRLSEEEVRYLLSNYHELNELKYLLADSTATDVVLTLESAIQKTVLTDREAAIFDCRFNRHMKLGKIKEELGGATWKLSREISEIVSKVAANT